MRIGIVGAGMAGLSCARGLRRKDHDTVSFDKSLGPGGRMSTRRIDTPLGQTAFNHGAQYFTVRNPAFVTQVVDWAEDCDVRWNARINALRHDGKWWIEDETFDAIVIAVPAEQVPALVEAHDSDLANTARSAVSDPCWTVMAALIGRYHPNPTD